MLLTPSSDRTIQMSQQMFVQLCLLCANYSLSLLFLADGAFRNAVSIP